MASPVKLLQSCMQCGYIQLKSFLRSQQKNASMLSVCRSFQFQQKRNHTIIMERVFPLPAGKDGGLPEPDQCNELHKILRPVEIQSYPSEMKCILTDFVEGIGIRGDVVNVKRTLFHQKLYPAKLAVYASPENIEDFELERKDKGIERAESRLGVFARMAMKELNHMELEIPMNENQIWTLTKSNVAVAFRIQGVEMDEDCIILPENPVTDFENLTVDIWINELESVPVKARIVPVSEMFSRKK